MKRDPELEAIVAAGMGESLPGDPNPAAGDDPRIDAFRRLAKGLRLARFEAPADCIAAARDLMPDLERRPLWARLVAGSLSPAGARAAAAESFQFVFEAEEVRARLMYVRDGKGWEVAGMAPSGWSPFRKGRPIRTDADGRFTFRANRLGDTGFLFVTSHSEIRIPAADKTQIDDPRAPD